MMNTAFGLKVDEFRFSNTMREIFFHYDDVILGCIMRLRFLQLTIQFDWRVVNTRLVYSVE